MIRRSDIDDRVREWGLRDDVVEKDYVLGWVLWGIATEPVISERWIFKGGTCLKKCYIETYRFSEDLDFSVLAGAPIAPDDVGPVVGRVLARVSEESGLDFAAMAPRFRSRPGGSSTEGTVYYRGPRSAPTPASIKLDLTSSDVVVEPPMLRDVAHPYSDGFPSANRVHCYSAEELFAEKLRAMAERSRPRDLYDIINLFRRPEFSADAARVRGILIAKCEHKSIPVPSIVAIEASIYRAELESEWANMLAHQLPALPPYEQFWAELPALFDWLEGRSQPAALPAFPEERDVEPGWAPPASVSVWGGTAPLEQIRFAAVNRLCVDLGYQGSVRTIEPYSLRRSRAGHLLVYAVKSDTRQPRSYRVDRIQSVRLTQRSFTPVYAIEFPSAGPLAAPLIPTTPRSPFGREPSEARYIVECSRCGRTFPRMTRDSSIRPHKDSNGWPCPGRRGHFVDRLY